MTICYLQIDYLYFILITLFFMGHEAGGIKARPNVVVHYFPIDVLAMSITQTYNKVLLTIVLCATSAWCSNGTSELIRNARTIGPLSFFAWPKALFRNQFNLSIFPKIWPNRPQLWEWTRSGAAKLLRFASFVNTGKRPIHMEFRPEEPHAAEVYQQRFGYRGKWLIEQLGNGFGPNIRLHRQPIPSTFLTPPLSYFRDSSNFY